MKKTYVVLSLLVFVFLVGYLYIRNVINSFAYTVTNVSFGKLSLDKITGTLTVNFNNLKLPNFIIKEIVLDVFLNGILIDTVKQSKETISQNGSVDLNLSFDVEPKEFLNLDKLTAIFKKDKIIMYKGYAVVSKFITFKIPIEYSYNLKS